MTKLLYLDDMYLKEFTAKVVDVVEEGVVLDQTAFYPRGGGQPADTGKLVANGKEFGVLNVERRDGKVVHFTDKQGLVEGDVVKGVIDFEKRYVYMRYHTASHIISALLFKELGALITGNQIGFEKLRIDFSIEDMDKELMKEFVLKANEEIAKNVKVKTYYLDRETAMKREGVVKLAIQLPKHIERIRIVEIGDVDMQADGGCHVKNTSEIGTLEFVKGENKGKNNRRMVVKLL